MSITTSFGTSGGNRGQLATCTRLGVVAVDVEDRRLDHLGDVGAIVAGARLGGAGGEADLVVDHDVQRAPGAVAFKLRQVEGLEVSPVGLAAVLDIAEPEERILVASYGSGAGSDAYLLRTTSQLVDKRKRQKVNVKFQAENPFIQYVDYTTYRRLKLGM